MTDPGDFIEQTKNPRPKRVRVISQDLADHIALPQSTLVEEPAQGQVWGLAK